MVAQEVVVGPFRSGAYAPAVTVRVATRRRPRAGRDRTVLRISGVMAAVVVLVMAYLYVVADMTRTNGELNALVDQRATLQEETMRNDDEIAKLESRERLSQVAARLGMSRSGAFVVVTIPAPRSAAGPSGGAVAFLSSVERWLTTH
jgi:cell division protein FtsL